MTRLEKNKRLVADILLQFMFANTMDDVNKVWDEIFTRYELEFDPFTGCPCTSEQYYESKKEYERQKAFEMFGHWDML